MNDQCDVICPDTSPSVSWQDKAIPMFI